MNEATQTGVAMAVIGLLGVVTGKLFDLLNTRDKLKYDTKLGALETQNATQGGQLSTQSTQIEALSAGQKKCQDDHAETKRLLTACNDSHKSTELRIDQIEAALAKKKDATEGHRPLD